MNQLQRRALANVPLTKETVEYFYDGSRSGTAEQCLHALCISHERLRAELEGAELLLNETPGKSAVRFLLTACKETVSVLRGLNDHEKVCRELIAAKIGDTDLAVVLSNVLRRLDTYSEAVEKSLSPKDLPDFELWMEETFYGRDVDLKMEAVPNAHIFTYDQAVSLATWIWSCMENKQPPWWGKTYGLEKKVAKAMALTDTGSEEFRKAFPPRSVGESINPRDIVPGWRVVEKIREVLLS